MPHFQKASCSTRERALRRIVARLALAGVAFALAPSIASADNVLHVPCSLDATELLRLHNQTREAMGVPPLRWSDQLAAGAQQWANELAVRNQMVHSHAPNVGENLAMWWGHHPSLDTMVGMWTDERGIFQPGIFPASSTGGSWQMVAHYTQMIWRSTTQVGCGVADNGRTEYLVCWYDPKGNIFGEDPLNPDQHGQFQSVAGEAPSRLAASQ